MQVLRSLDKEDWRDFVVEHPEGNVFHAPEMFEVFERAQGYRPELWAVTADNGEILALLLPVWVTLWGGLLRRLTSRAVAYGSVLCNHGLANHEALDALLQAYVQEVGSKVLFTELRNLSDLSPFQPVLNGCGFAYEEHLNYLIDLDRPVEDIMQGIGSRTRKNIRRGLRREEVVVDEVANREEVSICYSLLRRTYAAAQVPLADYSLFEAAFDVLHPKDMIRFVLARVDDAYVATSVELLYKDVVYGWYGGVDRAYSRYNPNELLMWHILRWSAENGYRTYDFGGAGRPDEEYGVRDFKAKFGGELVCFGRNTYIHNRPLMGLSQWAYSLYRKIL